MFHRLSTSSIYLRKFSKANTFLTPNTPLVCTFNFKVYTFILVIIPLSLICLVIHYTHRYPITGGIALQIWIIILNPKCFMPHQIREEKLACCLGRQKLGQIIPLFFYRSWIKFYGNVLFVQQRGVIIMVLVWSEVVECRVVVQELK